MSKFIFACSRSASAEIAEQLRRRVHAAAGELSPKSEHCRPAAVSVSDRVVLGIVNPSSTILADARSICLGHVSSGHDWSRTGESRPDGTYAICRSDSSAVELLSDEVASRTIWYYIDEELFLASTSQRWIIAVLGSFDPNDEVYTWMLTAGTLGPLHGWDRRLKRLPPASRLVLGTEDWTVELHTRPNDVEELPREGQSPEASLRQVLRRTFNELNFDYSKWILPLSGGYDSRAILYMLPDRTNLRTVTWGKSAAMAQRGSDAEIAARVAASENVQHEYFETDPEPGALSSVFEKFVAYGEGRTANISGYLDGFAIWETLLERGVEGIIRGDEAFGWKPARSLTDARRSLGLRVWSDFNGLPDLAEVELPAQNLPAWLRPAAHETVEQWRDRAYREYRIPTLLAALTDLKSPFVEVANPLLSSSIIRMARCLPDRLRTDKGLFKQLVRQMSGSIPFASTRAIAHQREIMRSAEAVDILSGTLTSGTARNLFSARLRSFFLQHMHNADSSTEARPMPVKHWFGLAAPQRLQRYVERVAARNQPRTDFNEMSFRLFIICRMHALLRQDAAAGRRVN